MAYILELDKPFRISERPPPLLLAIFMVALQVETSESEPRLIQNADKDGLEPHRA